MSKNEEMYDIFIDVPEEGVSLLSGIRSLSKLAPVKKQPEPVLDESEPLILSKIGKKKKDKKNKKGKKGLEMDYLSLGEVVNTSEDDTEDDLIDAIDNGDDNLLDIDALLNEDDDQIEDGIIDEQRKSYGKLKNQENPYKKEFAEELTLLYNLLHEIDKFGKDLEKKYKQIENSKVRGASKYVNDLIISILTSKTSKLSVLKEISSIKKIVNDLKIKEDGKKSNNAEGANAQQIASTYLQNILKVGRSNFTRQLLGSSSAGGIGESDNDELDELVDEIESGSNSYNESAMDAIQRKIEERLEIEGNPMRSEAGSRAIEYENRGVKIIVKKCTDTGEWEFVAVDRDNMIIHDYPVPDKGKVGKMKFSQDDRFATDGLGRTYKVQTYFSDMDD